MIALSDSLRIARLTVVAEALEAGTVRLYSTPQPATGAAITTQTLLVSFPIPSTLTVDADLIELPIDLGWAVATNDGEAVWCRWVNSAGNFVLDGDVGATHSGRLIEMNRTVFEAGETITARIATLTE